jgi:uncharacterized repeat protein (TIGR03843 family)
MQLRPELEHDAIELRGRIPTASNATFLGTIGETQVIYKPSEGERPLWDFPDGDLAQREVAAYLVSRASGWDIVPLTWLRDGPLGMGMVQLWKEPDPAQTAVDIVFADEVPDAGWRAVFDGVDENEKDVTLIHEDSAALRRMAVFDAVVNNADRKGAHILEMAAGHRHGVDHGLTFHVEHKLRTVLWGWVDEPLNDDELAGIERMRDAASSPELDALLGDLQLAAFVGRCDRLTRDGRFPTPHGDMPAFPWPLF